MLISLFTRCAFKSIRRSKNITYTAADTVNHIAVQKLNVFAPRNTNSLKEVLVFIYGGNWNSGKKWIYSYLGSRMARKDVVMVILDYPKSPKANYDMMATDAAKAVQWVKENIERYGGDPNKIFISGHSAGGHLASLITVRNDYFTALGIKNPIKGAILIDAAGIDMYGYLQQQNFPDNNTYIKTFGNNPDEWKKASTLYHLNKGMPPMLIYVGEKTYPSIMNGNTKLVAALKLLDVPFNYQILKGKKHIPMILQFFNPKNIRYKEIINFMKTTKKE